MTLNYERHRAVVSTEQFLLDLCNPQKTPRIPKDIRRQAASLLKHYPSKFNMEQAAEQCPKIFGTDWRKEYE
jgi:hypothetical protein